jgi:hypothetical protein
MTFNLDISLNKTQLSTHNPQLNSCDSLTDVKSTGI